MSSDLFEQVANIAKAHNADIYAKQVQELKECNRELIFNLEYCLDMLRQTKIDLYGGEQIEALINKAKILSL